MNIHRKPLITIGAPWKDVMKIIIAFWINRASIPQAKNKTNMSSREPGAIKRDKKTPTKPPIINTPNQYKKYNRIAPTAPANKAIRTGSPVARPIPNPNEKPTRKPKRAKKILNRLYPYRSRSRPTGISRIDIVRE